jgi:hypothetical protein
VPSDACILAGSSLHHFSPVGCFGLRDIAGSSSNINLNRQPGRGILYATASGGIAVSSTNVAGPEFQWSRAPFWRVLSYPERANPHEYRCNSRWMGCAATSYWRKEPAMDHLLRWHHSWVRLGVIGRIEIPRIAAVSCQGVLFFRPWHVQRFRSTPRTC